MNKVYIRTQKDATVLRKHEMDRFEGALLGRRKMDLKSNTVAFVELFLLPAPDPEK